MSPTSVFLNPCQFLLDGDTSNLPSSTTCQVPTSITTQCRPLPLTTAVPRLHCPSIFSPTTSCLIVHRKCPFSCTQKGTTSAPALHATHICTCLFSLYLERMHLSFTPSGLHSPSPLGSVQFLSVPLLPPVDLPLREEGAQYACSWSHPSEQVLRSLRARAM